MLQNDPWGAARYYAEAEKQEELAENTATELNVSKTLLHMLSGSGPAAFNTAGEDLNV
jgi:hypothetical protein